MLPMLMESHQSSTTAEPNLKAAETYTAFYMLDSVKDRQVTHWLDGLKDFLCILEVEVLKPTARREANGLDFKHPATIPPCPSPSSLILSFGALPVGCCGRMIPAT